MSRIFKGRFPLHFLCVRRRTERTNVGDGDTSEGKRRHVRERDKGERTAAAPFNRSAGADHTGATRTHTLLKEASDHHLTH